MNEWNIKTASDTYNLERWGEGYVAITDDGHLVVHPQPGAAQPGIDLRVLVDEIHAKGMTSPVLVRFTGILQHRVRQLCQVFENAIRSDSYRGRYTAVYPIKVNQQRRVVEEILSGREGSVGLEAGSKPELMAVLALAPQDGGIIVCNGYKDSEYLRLAMLGQQLGHRVYIVIEKLSELDTVIKLAAQLGISPTLGIRVRLAAIAAGKWQNTGGEKSKFGLSANQVLQAVARLQAAGMLTSLEMLHFHMGSQIANIRDVQLAMRECARFYTELHTLGANIRCVDVGGGLGIDYEGTGTRSFCSMNYGLQEYANNIVHSLWEACESEGIAHPDIITESGRAMTAHHAMLISKVIDVEQAYDSSSILPVDENDPLIMQAMWNALQQLDDANAIETWHEIAHWISEAQQMYTHGVLTLGQRARIEQLYFACCDRLRSHLSPQHRTSREIIDELKDKLADKYFCNFSLFQSLPDVWAIDQIFPIVPLQRLNERPERRAVLHDITCDSDGRIDHYVDSAGVETSLPIHAVSADEEYYLGMFLIGAYQEILGDIHNLFGDTHSVHVVFQEDGSHHIEEPVSGETVENVLAAVGFSADDLLAIYELKVEATDMGYEDRADCMQLLRHGLQGYTYFED